MPEHADQEMPRQPDPSRKDRRRARIGLVVFILLLLGAYAIDHMSGFRSEGRPLREQLGLDGRRFSLDRWWTPATYVFFHFDPLHLFLNVGALALFGHALSETWSWRRIALLILASSLGGAALWLGIHHGQRSTVIGASAVACGFVTAFAMIRPTGRVPLPGTAWSFPRWVLPALLTGAEGLGLWSELKGPLARGALSHSAHIGGVVSAGLLCLLLRAQTTKRPALPGGGI